MRRLTLPLLFLLLLAVTSACGLSRTNTGGWISGDGQVQSVAKLGSAVSLSGKTLQGADFDLTSTRGKVTVVNVWGAWCADCIKEADYLQAAHAELGDSVAFLGIDIRDTSVDQAIAFERGHGITYPSISSPDGQAVLAFAANVSPQTIPATLILDAQGRVATVIRGQLPSELTLEEAVADVQKRTLS